MDKGDDAKLLSEGSHGGSPLRVMSHDMGVKDIADLDVLVQGPYRELEQVMIGASAEDESFCLRGSRNWLVGMCCGVSDSALT